MGKISSLRADLCLAVEQELTVFAFKYVCPGRWGVPDLRAHPILEKALVKWIENLMGEGLGDVRLAINSLYRPALGGVGVGEYSYQKYDYIDLLDPRGHWAGLAVDIGLKETAEYLWGKKAFAGGVVSYRTLGSKYVDILNRTAKGAGLSRVFLRLGEWWHYSFDDKEAREESFIWHSYYRPGEMGIRPSKHIQEKRRALLRQVV